MCLLQSYKYHKSYNLSTMAKDSRKVKHGIKTSTLGTSYKHAGVELSGAQMSIKSLKEAGGFRILGKEDIKKELARTKELYGMTPDEFYRSWKEDKVHGFHATKLGCLYEFYRDEYE